MRTARPLGLSPDGHSVLVVTDAGETLAVRAGQQLRAATRRDRPRPGQLEIEMDSALTPREIQARIRAGASVEDVARAAGVPVEKVDVYAGPVLAERGHVTAMALTSSARRRGETTGHRNLRSLVNERLMARGVDIDAVEWDAWRNEGRRWTLQARYPSGRTQHEALFTFDMAGRFSVASNDEARWVLGELSTAHGPQPGRRRSADDPDSEPTIDLDDEFALVRATQDDVPAASPAAGEPDEVGHEPEEVADRDADEGDGSEGDGGEGDGDEDTEGDGAVGDGERYPTSGSSPVEDVYDVLPAPESELDVLYEMLGGFNEDSVNIYAGLSDPVTEDPAQVVTADQLDEAGEAVETGAAGETGETGTAEVTDAVESTEPEQPSLLEGEDTPTAEAEDTPTAGAEDTPDAEAKDSPSDPEIEDTPAATEGEGNPASTEKTPKPRPTPRSRNKRASVPSWDEIMFGSPKR